jgi:hypothetical protein
MRGKSDLQIIGVQLNTCRRDAACNMPRQAQPAQLQGNVSTYHSKTCKKGTSTCTCC